MNTEKVKVVGLVRSSVTNTVESLGEGLRIVANVTEQNGAITSIDGIRVQDPDAEATLWEGYANPTVGGNFYSEGREIEVMTALMEFINAVKN